MSRRVPALTRDEIKGAAIVIGLFLAGMAGLICIVHYLLDHPEIFS